MKVFPILSSLLLSVGAHATHFYTTDRSGELAPKSYKAEGVAAHVFTTSRPGTVPVFRFNHSKTEDHLYTTDANGEGSVANLGYVKDYNGSPVFFCYPNQVKGTAPLYRFYNSKYNDHFYTTDPKGSDDPKFAGGYKAEGHLCFVYANSPAKNIGVSPLYRWFKFRKSDDGGCSWKWSPGPSNTLSFECK